MSMVLTDEEHCPGCGGAYNEGEEDLSGCDVCDKHWWHYRCAGYKRRPNLRRHFACPLCSKLKTSHMQELDLLFHFLQENETGT